ncbi:MAG: amidohydrolase family protein [Roseivirga sp.]|nr:amidohydrolase family protein [Roseivirga sp.]
MRRLFYSLPFLFLLSVCACQPQEISHDLIIQNVNIVDVEKGKILHNQTVAIDGDKIGEIYRSSVVASPETEVIDGTGKFLIPGLWDMHTHYFWNYTFSNPLLIANGITGVREMWGNPDVINTVRQQTTAGEMIAPDIYTAGAIIDGVPPIWPGSSGVANPEEAIAEVDKQIASGVDFLKVYSRLTKDAYMAIAQRSKEKDISFAGHIPGSVSIWEAMEAGQYSSEHMYGILEASNSDLATLRAQPSQFSKKSMQLMTDNFDEAIFDSLATVMANSDMWLSPTLTVLRSIAYLTDSSFTNDERLGYLPAFMTGTWNPANDFRFKSRTPEFYEASKTKFRLQLSLMGKLANKGVKIIAGTDYPNPYCFPGFSLHDELELMVEGGMTTLQALQAATINAAIFQKKESQFGTVTSGKTASLVLLNANPVDDINHTREIEKVILRGKVHNRAALDAMLEQAKKAVGRGN